MKNLIYIILLSSATMLNAQNNNIFSGGIGDGYSSPCLGTGGEVPLPVELLSFNAELNNGQVNLEWATASEFNNNYFIIQRSIDGVSFEDIIHVTGSGNSSMVKKYSTVDYDPYSGVSFYRLKQVDYNGQSALFRTVKVNLSNSILYENSSSGHITFKGEKQFVNIYTMVGTCVYSASTEKEIVISLNPGIYVLATSSLNEKIIVK